MAGPSCAILKGLNRAAVWTRWASSFFYLSVNLVYVWLQVPGCGGLARDKTTPANGGRARAPGALANEARSADRDRPKIAGFHFGFSIKESDGGAAVYYSMRAGGDGLFWSSRGAAAFLRSAAGPLSRVPSGHRAARLVRCDSPQRQSPALTNAFRQTTVSSVDGS